MGRATGDSSLRSFLPDQRGSTAVEFALLAIPFLGLLCAIIETGLVLLVGSTINNVTEKVARTIQTGQAQQAGVTTADALRSQFVCPATGSGFLPSFIPCSALIIDVRTVTNYADADVTSPFYNDPANLKFCLGGAGALVVVRVAFAMPVFLPMLASATNNTFGPTTSGLVNNIQGHPGWMHLLLGSTLFQNEQSAGSTNSNCS